MRVSQSLGRPAVSRRRNAVLVTVMLRDALLMHQQESGIQP